MIIDSIARAQYINVTDTHAYTDSRVATATATVTIKNYKFQE